LIQPPHQNSGKSKTYSRTQIAKINAYIRGDIDHLDFLGGPPRTWQEIYGKAVNDNRVAKQTDVHLPERVQYVQAVKSLARTYFPGAPMDPNLYYPMGLIDAMMVLEINDMVTPSGSPTYMLDGGIETFDRNWVTSADREEFATETGWGSRRIKMPRWQDWSKVAGWTLRYITSSKSDSFVSISTAIASESGSKNAQYYIEQQLRKACLLLQLRVPGM
jgi:hypothetical protein